MIKVLHPGFFTTIQDLGRKDFQHLGVPLSGAMDTYAAKMANAIIGNDENCAVMEITILGPKLEFTCDTVISITGADLSPSLNGNNFNNNKVININKGDVLSFGKLTKGFRSYLAVFEGFKPEIVLRSRSMYQGITKDFRLQEGDEFEIKYKSHLSKKYSSIKVNNDYLNNRFISAFKGPEFENLSDKQINLLFNREFTISKENNRMAYQLNELVSNDLNSIITSLVLPGTVQITPSGTLIILMRDCQTTGGYPRILQLSEGSINILSQKKVGDSFLFKLINYPS